jgi:hypothetical protein
VRTSRGGVRGTPSPPSPSTVGGGGSGSRTSAALSDTSHILLRTPPAAAHAKTGTYRASTPSTLASTPGGDVAATTAASAPFSSSSSSSTGTRRKEKDDGRAVPVDLHVRIVTSCSSNSSVAANGGRERGGGSRLGTSVLDGTDNDNGGGDGDASGLVHQLLEVRFDDLVRREEEMWHVARTFAVPPGRWNGSRLYQCYQHEMTERAERSKYHDHDPLHQEQQPPPQPKPLVLFLDPTAFCCREQHLSSVFRWKPWLGEMMQSYLRTGILTVNKDATGDDWLLCCEFFSVLYQPSQVVFETLQAYQNVSSWSDYLSKRCDLAEWVADSVLRRHETVFVVTHKQDSGWSVEVDQLSKPAAGFVDEMAALPLADFFHDDDHPVDRETRQVRMRADFCGYLEHVMSHVHCRFDMELVTLTNQVQRFAPRAVLRVRMLLNPPPPPVSQPKKTRSELPYPVDELVAEDLQEGRLEKLVQKVDARNPASAPESAPANEARPLQLDAVRSGHAPENAKASDEPHAPNHSLAMASVKAHQTLVDGLPFSVIRTTSTGEGNQSVTSALTGPFLFDEDGIMREPSEFYDAAVLAAAGGKWRSRDPALLPSHAKALADDDTTKSQEVDSTPREPVKGNPAISADVPKKLDGERADEKELDADEEQWDWLTNICQYSAAFLSGQKESPSPSDTPKMASEEPNARKDQDSKRSAKLLELQTKAAESRSQKVPGGVHADTHQEEIRVVSLHREVEANTGRNHTAAAVGVPAAHSRRIHDVDAPPDCVSNSTGSSNGGRDRPEPSTKTRSRAGYESQATSTVSATLQPNSSNRSHASQKRLLITPKRLVLKGLFRRHHKAEV